jgi:hypothetical protein
MNQDKLPLGNDRKTSAGTMDSSPAIRRWAGGYRLFNANGVTSQSPGSQAQ